MNAWRISLGLLLAVLAFGRLPLSLADEPLAPKFKDASNATLKHLILAKVVDDKDEPAADESEAPEEEAKVDPFVLPETDDVAELMKYLEGVLNYKPKTREELIRSRVRRDAAMKEAAEKIVAKASDEDKKLPGYKDAEGIVLLARAQKRDLSDEDEGKLLDELKANIAANPDPSAYAVTAVRLLASKYEYGGEPDRAAVIYNEVGPILAKSSNEQLARAGVMMEGAARRLTLVGKPMEVTGTEIDGTPFDWSKLRGKVVLVDFWATWCGPCRAEMPNVRKNYELYHDKGFEVVAISLDRDRGALERFLAEEQTPWITLHDGDWKDNSVATHYGVMGIPTVILVDKDGKVVSTRARGEELVRLLAEQLGPPPEPAEEDGEAKDATDDAAAKAE